MTEVKPYIGRLAVSRIPNPDEQETELRSESLGPFRIITGVEPGIVAGIVVGVGPGVEEISSGHKVYYPDGTQVKIGDVEIIQASYIIAWEEENA